MTGTNDGTEERINLLEQSLGQQLAISKGLKEVLTTMADAIDNLAARVRALETNNPRGNPSGLLHFDDK